MPELATAQVLKEEPQTVSCLLRFNSKIQLCVIMMCPCFRSNGLLSDKSEKSIAVPASVLQGSYMLTSADAGTIIVEQMVPLLTE